MEFDENNSGDIGKFMLLLLCINSIILYVTIILYMHDKVDMCFYRYDGAEEDDGEAWPTQNTFRVKENDR